MFSPLTRMSDVKRSMGHNKEEQGDEWTGWRSSALSLVLGSAP